MSSEFDVIVLGPTGVTGREVVRYLGRRAPEAGVRWAVAGRSPDRISAVLADVGAEPDGILTADVTDSASVRVLAESTAVIVNLVGPYARFGEPVHAACAAAGTDQLDLTGEVDWVRTMIDRYGSMAEASGARLVPSSGFESLPFDLGARLAALVANERSGSPVIEVDVAVTIVAEARLRALSDAVSGGTFQSGVDVFERGSGAATSDPFFLDPGASSGSGSYRWTPRRHPATGEWLSPVFPSPVLNPPVVHRGAALSRSAGETLFAPHFRYREGSVVSSMVPLPGASLLAPGMAASMGVAQSAQSLSGLLPGPVRRAVAGAARRIGPAAGEGPKPEDLDDWRYRLDVRAECADGTTADVAVTASGHPGYKSTATMVAEAGLILADADAPVPASAGYVSPAGALGVEVLERFEAAGLRFRVVG
ncbi:MAG: hypothetical protein AAGD18_09935 [Actinomycetota bacterium]